MLKLKRITCLTSYFLSVFSYPSMPIFSSFWTASFTVFSNFLNLVFTRPSHFVWTLPSSYIFCCSIKFKLRFLLRPSPYLPVLSCVPPPPHFCFCTRDLSCYIWLVLSGISGYFNFSICFVPSLYIFYRSLSSSSLSRDSWILFAGYFLLSASLSLSNL